MKIIVFWDAVPFQRTCCFYLVPWVEAVSIRASHPRGR